MTAIRDLSDKRLLDQLRAGDEQAFAEIFERFWPLLLRNALRFTGDPDEANDVVQDVLATLWEKRSALEIHNSLAGYLYTATRNRMLMTIRHSKRWEQYQQILKASWEEGLSLIDEEMAAKELAQRFEEELSQLPPQMREAFTLSRIHELSYQEIAVKMDLTDNTVKHHISRALKKLRSKLNALIFFQL